MTHEDFDAVAALSEELSLPAWQVERACALLGEGATVPFIARYRKEATGGLDEVQLRQMEERRAALLELHQRRLAILASVAEQGALTPALEARLRACQTRAELEDLYLPYRPKRRTRATRARELGLEPLAQKILAQPAQGSPLEEARRFVKGEVEGAEAALAGARDIVAEVAAEDADWRAYTRDQTRRFGVLCSQAAKGKAEEQDNYAMYKDFREPVGRAASHRLLAVLRGEREGALKVKVEVDGERVVARGLGLLRHRPQSPWGAALAEAVEDGYKRLLEPAVTREVMGEARERADREAVEVFAENLKHLLLAAPLGQRSVVGVDPGLRTGCKLAAVDATGRYLGTDTIYPIKGVGDVERAKADFLRFLRGTTRWPSRWATARPGARPRRSCARCCATPGPEPEAAGGAGERVGRQHLQRVGHRARRVPGPGPHHPRRHQHRAAPARPAGRAGEDRPQVHRRGAVPARRAPEPAQAEAGRGGGELRERRGRGAQHGQRAAAQLRGRRG
jgi:uncharacterized protein